MNGAFVSFFALTEQDKRDVFEEAIAVCQLMNENLAIEESQTYSIQGKHCHSCVWQNLAV